MMAGVGMMSNVLCE